MIEGSCNREMRKIQRFIGIYFESDLSELADSLCGAALVGDEGNQPYGLFRFVDKCDPHVAYFNPVGGILADDWKLELDYH